MYASASSNALLVTFLVTHAMGSATSALSGSRTDTGGGSEDVAGYTMLPQMHVAPASSQLHAPTTIYPLSQACSQALDSRTAAIALAACSTPSAATYASAAVTAAAMLPPAAVAMTTSASAAAAASATAATAATAEWPLCTERRAKPPRHATAVNDEASSANDG